MKRYYVYPTKDPAPRKEYWIQEGTQWNPLFIWYDLDHKANKRSIEIGYITDECVTSTHFKPQRKPDYSDRELHELTTEEEIGELTLLML
jgi:hypothetical protein